MKIYGIASTADIDRAGERIDLEGMDISKVRNFNDEHESRNCFDVLGYVHEAKKIYAEQDCTDEYQKRCWGLVKRPFVYVAGELLDEEGHENAKAAAAFVRYGVKNPSIAVGFSVEGSTLEREGNVLKRTEVINVSITKKPANPNCRVFPVIDLAKSHMDVQCPEKYKGNYVGRKAFRDLPGPHERFQAKIALLSDMKTLLKSDNPNTSGATILKCWNCGEGKLFMKSRLPNRCVACSNSFSMLELFNSLNKDYTP